MKEQSFLETFDKTFGTTLCTEHDSILESVKIASLAIQNMVKAVYNQEIDPLDINKQFGIFATQVVTDKATNTEYMIIISSFSNFVKLKDLDTLNVKDYNTKKSYKLNNLVYSYNNEIPYLFKYMDMDIHIKLPLNITIYETKKIKEDSDTLFYQIVQNSNKFFYETTFSNCLANKAKNPQKFDLFPTKNTFIKEEIARLSNHIIDNISSTLDILIEKDDVISSNELKFDFLEYKVNQLRMKSE